MRADNNTVVFKFKQYTVKAHGMVPILIDKYVFGPSYHDLKGFPGSSVSEKSACNAGDARNVSSIPGLGRSSGRGHGNPSSIFV